MEKLSRQKLLINVLDTLAEKVRKSILQKQQKPYELIMYFYVFFLYEQLRHYHLDINQLLN